MPSDCTRHMVGSKAYAKEACPICKMEGEVNRLLARVMPQAPRYRYWRIRRAAGRSERTFEYTTETAEQGKYWAVERRWVRVKGGERGKIVRKAGFKLRKKAKERAYAWYTKAQSSAPVTV